jgi:hypothetical protein
VPEDLFWDERERRKKREKKFRRRYEKRKAARGF